MKRIYLIDCPGVVPPSNGDSEQDILLRGVVRVENVENPAQYIAAVLRRAQTRHIERTYEIKHSEYNDDAIEFLSMLARKGGRLLRGGEPDVDGVAKMVLNDFLRGKIPWFSAPPKKDVVADGDRQEELRVDGREGRLGEMPSKGQKRKRDQADTEPVGSDARDDAGSDRLEEDAEDNVGVDAQEDEGDALEKRLGISEDDDAGDSGAEEDRTRLEEEGGQDCVIGPPFEAFNSDEEEDDSPGMLGGASSTN